MNEVRYTRNLFLRGICIVYLFAFISTYVQIPGLYGDNGLLPARTQLDLKGKASLWQKLNYKPTILWLAPYLGLNIEYMLDLVALAGTLIAFLGFISQRFCTAPLFLALWALYYSLYQVGQVFVQHQWDNLLLEVGCLSIFIAPFFVSRRSKVSTPSDGLTFWAVRWLLFRFFFSAGAVKLSSGCPVWWNLDGLSHHFETQCLPGLLAWYAHHLPTWYLRFASVFTIVSELAIPLLFFFPNRKVRLAAFYLQIFFVLNIMLTGNWNFRDFLVICMLTSLLDDFYFYKRRPKNDSVVRNYLSMLICLVVYGVIIYGCVVLFKLRFVDSTIQSEIGFTQKDYDYFLLRMIPIAMFIGITSLGFAVADAVTNSILSTKGTMKTIATTISTFIYTAVICFIFVMSMVPLSTLHPSQNATVPVQVKAIYSKIDHLQIVNKYGLFRRMTGVEGRPEIIIEGSNDIDGPWKEYEFLYKPGNVNNSLPFVAPHSPRLDWQMWFAALETYHQNPWIMSLTYRLLSGQPEVLALLNTVESSPFVHNPPKYIKASLYHYHFVPWRKGGNDQQWWTRERVGEYFPIFSRDHPPLLEYLSKMKILQDKPTVKVTNEPLKIILDSIRMLASKIEASLLLWSVFTAGCAIIMTGSNNPPSRRK